MLSFGKTPAFPGMLLITVQGVDNGSISDNGHKLILFLEFPYMQIPSFSSSLGADLQ